MLAFALAFIAGAQSALLAAAAVGQSEAQAPSSVKSGNILHGHVSSQQSPFLPGQVETVTPGAKVNLVLSGNLNSEISQKGDELFAQVAIDLKDGQKVLLPSGWYLHGLVTDVKSQRRLGRDGYVDVEFDKLVSPDGNYELPFHARFSTADNKLKAVAKVVAQDSVLMTKGAIVGSLLSVQATGLPVAIGTHGISVGVGAAAGAGLGLIGALKRKGKIASLYPSDETQLTIAEPISLPGFNPEALAKLAPKPLANFDLIVLKKKFAKDPNGDEASRLLTIELKMDNRTDLEYSFFDLAVVSDHNQRYYPYVFGANSSWKVKVPAHSVGQGSMSFIVDSPKHKYWLVILDKKNRQELSRVAVN